MDQKKTGNIDAIWQATSEILLPEVELHGFRKATKRMMARLQEGILQSIDIGLSFRGTKSFHISYSSLSLFNYRDAFLLLPGGILGPAGKPRKLIHYFLKSKERSYYPGKTVHEAQESMKALVKLFRKEALPFFERTNTVESLLEYLMNEEWAMKHHLEFEIGCCLARLGRWKLAKQHLMRAKCLYAESSFDWAKDYEKRVEMLLSAINENAAEKLLDHWQAESIRNLSIDHLIKRHSSVSLCPKGQM